MDTKKTLADKIANITGLTNEKIISFIEVPNDVKNGDLSLPCFKLAKDLKKAPVQIADSIKEELDKVASELMLEKIENVNGFLNFYIEKEKIAKTIVENFKKQEEDYGKSELGKGKTVLVEYSSPNIAKPFHIGHLKNTIMGHSLYNLYKYLGYNTISLNHLGDYGTQFAKLIEGYKRWKDEYDFSENPIDKLADIYKRINTLCEEQPEILEECRQTFKKLEDGDEECIALWNKFKDLSLKEFEKIYDLLNIKFDSMKGEAFYSDKMDEVIELLEKSGKLEESNGARIVDLSDQGIDTPCIIQKANGSSIYATRDLAAILYRTRTYDFDKCLYVVGGEQALHFKQIFATAKYLGIDQKYLDGLEHIAYGMIKLPEGKMSTRQGNFVKGQDLLDEVMARSLEIMKDRDVKNKEDLAKKIALAAIIFDDLKDSRVKEQVFDIKEALNFNGETGPYIQYTVVRTKSILEKVKDKIDGNNIDYSLLTDENSITLLKKIAEFPEILELAQRKNEISFIARYAVTLAQIYNSFYNKNKVIVDDKELEKARIYLTYMTNITLTNALYILGIETIDEM